MRFKNLINDGAGYQPLLWTFQCRLSTIMDLKVHSIITGLHLDATSELKQGDFHLQKVIVACLHSFDFTPNADTIYSSIMATSVMKNNCY